MQRFDTLSTGRTPRLLGTVLFLLCALFSPATALYAAPQAQIPPTINYQGTLRDAQGNLVNGERTMTFRIYDAAIAGNLLHEEEIAGVTVRDGIFNVVLGDAKSFTANVFASGPRFIGITVAPETEEMIPRQRLHPVPWTQLASTAITLVKDAIVNGLTIEKGKRIELVDPSASISFNQSVNANGTWVLANQATGDIIAIPNNGNISVNRNLLVNGVIAVNNAMTMLAIRTVNGASANYVMDVGRFVTEASSTTQLVNQLWVDSLCGDEDGCSITLAERNWTPSFPNTLRHYGPFNYSVAAHANGRAVVRSTQGGDTQIIVDGDGTNADLLNGWGTCVLQDYLNPSPDSTPGLFLRALSGKTCLLIIED
jgi:hypothetical protein